MESLIRVHNSCEVQQPNWRFMFTITKCCVLKTITTSPILYGVLIHFLTRFCGLVFYATATDLVRGFRPKPVNENKRPIVPHDKNAVSPMTDLTHEIRQQRPSLALLGLLHRRLQQSERHVKSVALRIGCSLAAATRWLLPCQCPVRKSSFGRTRYPACTMAEYFACNASVAVRTIVLMNNAVAAFQAVPISWVNIFKNEGH
jgi:hypothetical protein